MLLYNIIFFSNSIFAIFSRGEKPSAVVSYTYSISVAILTLNCFLPKGHCTEVFFPSMLLIPLLVVPILLTFRVAVDKVKCLTEIELPFSIHARSKYTD